MTEGGAVKKINRVILPVVLPEVWSHTRYVTVHLNDARKRQQKTHHLVRFIEESERARLG